MNENNQANNQATSQDIQKTVVNGKVVSLRQAQQMEEQFNKQNNQTGIQQHHNNASESVQAGQVAQNQVNAQNQNGQASFMKQANVQSGQGYMGQSAGTETHEQQMKQVDHDAMQSSMDAKGSSKAKAKKEN